MNELLCLAIVFERDMFFLLSSLYQIRCITSMVFVQAQVMTAICCYLVFRKRPVPCNGSIIIVIKHRLLSSCYESAISHCVLLYSGVTQKEIDNVRNKKGLGEGGGGGG